MMFDVILPRDIRVGHGLHYRSRRDARRTRRRRSRGHPQHREILNFAALTYKEPTALVLGKKERNHRAKVSRLSPGGVSMEAGYSVFTPEPAKPLPTDLREDEDTMERRNKFWYYFRQRQTYQPLVLWRIRTSEYIVHGERTHNDAGRCGSGN
ncbi:uncharacterized protein LOC124309222 [Neodiprion virginianus]|uniref:uncharacterized protein LOC124309222 n=1 Tax=Neodiprion virginianus TaxID=2961670 RepID=UPI001EE740A9|nr:uncharacterized protein LOC124309222 [Neodiprion virginianus]XP_046628600.1 uncharacterized protein LOC124309222 [Neodiprion virginianus]